MAQITVYAQGTMNWDAADGWNSASGGGGTAYTNPQNGSDTYICNLNGQDVTLNIDATVDLVTGASGTLITSGTRVLTSPVTFSGTATTGFVTAPNGTDLTVLGLVTNSNTGRGAVYGPGTGNITITNVGGAAVSNTNTGICIYYTGTGTYTINGNIGVSNGSGIRASTGISIGVVNGDIAAIVAGNGLYLTSGVGSYCTVNGELVTTRSGIAIYSGGYNNSYVKWTGTRTIAAGTDCYIYINGIGFCGLNLDGLRLALGGRLLIFDNFGFVTPGDAVITLQSAAAQFCAMGQDSFSYTLNATGPTLPSADDVQSGAADFGYAGSVLDPSYPTTATTQATDAATLEADKDYLLATKTITFGASEVTGTLAVANVLEAVTGGTYHAPDAAEVISTAVFGPSSGTAGTYDVTNVAAGNIKDGVSIGGVEGTFVGGPLVGPSALVG